MDGEPDLTLLFQPAPDAVRLCAQEYGQRQVFTGLDEVGQLHNQAMTRVCNREAGHRRGCCDHSTCGRFHQED